MKQIDEARKLDAIFNTVVDGIITINRRGEIESFNNAATQLFGYEAAEVVGHNIKVLMPEPYRHQHDSYLKNYETTGAKKIIGFGREVKGQRKDGSIFPFLLSVSEVPLSNDEIIYTGIIHDISQLKEAERSLRESENKLNAIINNAVDGIITIDERGIMQTVNPATATLFGYMPLELLGQNVSVLMPEPQQYEHDGYMRQYRKTGKKHIIGIGREEMGQRKDGSTFPCLLSISEIDLGERKLFAGIVHDLSEQKAAESRIKKLNAELEKRVEERTEKLVEVVNRLLLTNDALKREIQERKAVEEALKKSQNEVHKALEKERELNELKSRFVSMASHEFRTPLSTILSSAALISRYTTSETADKREKHINRIKSAVSNLTGILNDFLSLSKLEEGHIENKPERFSIVEFSLEMVEDLQGILKPAQQIIYQHKGDTEEISLDKKFIHNVCINLLSNAIKYSDKAILFTTTVTHDKIYISVKDQGIGIPKEEQEYLFTRFFRAKNATNIQGTGLGLNIVRKYLELMGGEIVFESELNKGTTFKVIFPR
jgi:two-component system, LuxR family, sensor kinase FixL